MSLKGAYIYVRLRDGLDSIPYILQKKVHMYTFFYIPFLNSAGVVRQCRRKQKSKIGGKRKC